MVGKGLHLDKSASTPVLVGEKQAIGAWPANTATQNLSTIRRRHFFLRR